MADGRQRSKRPRPRPAQRPAAGSSSRQQQQAGPPPSRRQRREDGQQPAGAEQRQEEPPQQPLAEAEGPRRRKRPAGRRSQAFSGRGHRLDVREQEEDAEPRPAAAASRRGIPNYNFQIGRITFMRDSQPAAEREAREEEAGSRSQFIPFSGTAHVLGRKKGP
ncbi:ubiquitin recognition factor in ER-associated degradation protein 1-like [Pogoniulus pusillus]|uniref:ubiquitin recognition factor in ER-associated degradation protein 1-like n=1 Tax=Pogoniulus pusillus TaxID=488313 RepID=UPI0030B925FA